MTRAEANRVLDAAREGAPVSTADISRALVETGDLDSNVNAYAWVVVVEDAIQRSFEVAA